MEKICKNCRWWKETPRTDGMGKCRNIFFSRDGRGDFEKAKSLFYWAGKKNVEAYFSTGPEFGCVHWEAESV